MEQTSNSSLSQCVIKLQVERKNVLYKRVMDMFFRHHHFGKTFSVDKLILALNALNAGLESIDAILQPDKVGSQIAQEQNSALAEDALKHQDELFQIHPELAQHFFIILNQGAPYNIAFTEKYHPNTKTTRSTLKAVESSAYEEKQRIKKFQKNPEQKIEKYHNHSFYNL